MLGKEKISLFDIGASGGLEPRWKKIENNLKAILFEPDERSYLELEKNEYVKKIFSVGLSDAVKKGVIYLTKKPQVSSLFKPNMNFLSGFPNSERFDIVEELSIELSTLDECLSKEPIDCDFIKLDTQGTELDIIKGGRDLMNGPVIGLEIEVEFVELYEGQPLFGDVCSYLAKHGYDFIDFVNICRWERSKFTQFGQLVFGDALFLSELDSFSLQLKSLPQDVAKSKAVKYIAIAILYDHIDLVPKCLSVFEQYITDDQKRKIMKLYRKKLKQRQYVEFVLRVTNHFLKWTGTIATGVQGR